jgi:hypothetical protein
MLALPFLPGLPPCIRHGTHVAHCQLTDGTLRVFGALGIRDNGKKPNDTMTSSGNKLVTVPAKT